ncbi:MAG: hypothetical protein ABJB66_11790, partial [Gemmatimonadaceae bacterium]
TSRQPRRNLESMDIWIAGAVGLLVAWAAITLTTDAPGYVHLMLTGGMFLLIWRIVVRGTPAGPRSTTSTSTPPSTPAAKDGNKKK